MEETPQILDARAKLRAKFDTRIGGKGTQRRKVKAKTASVAVNDDKKTQTQFKKMGLNNIPGIEEVNMFTDKNEVIHFKEPKVLASLQANTYAISGSCETKTLQEMLPKVISQMGNQNLSSLRKMMEAAASTYQADSAGAADDDIPDVGDTNFEDVSKS